MLIAASVKDGQLFWCAIGLCAAAIYEAVTALEQGSRETSMLALSIVGFCGLAFVCSTIVTMSLLKVWRDRFDRLDAAMSDRRTALPGGEFSLAAIVMSILLTCVAAVPFAILHIHLN
ncbi:hypothetical protein [Paraburkholderia antibiotica]|uniref:hypothetical protein n=1 Tax=Paraburkholderia antibiotica TaxID=2728839 RepID=UPI001E62CCD3|nr:hypothetical protein [Paraburkholderia antibiotica]